ncbi:MAG: hypothetical protein ACLQVN_21200 [Bryobacteraceae bacterium]
MRKNGVSGNYGVAGYVLARFAAHESFHDVLGKSYAEPHRFPFRMRVAVRRNRPTARSEEEVRAIAAALPVAEDYGFAQNFYFDVLPWRCHIVSIIPQFNGRPVGGSG